ncbi:cation transporter, partial [bacterium]|nr:cation transporter [bacterium]
MAQPAPYLNPAERQRLVGRAVNLGLATNIFLAVVKTLSGILGHSQALLADGINSTSDVTYYIAVKIFTGHAGKPADREHPYGHHQMESIAALVVGAFVVTTGIAIFWKAINDVFDLFSGGGEIRPELERFTLWIALFTVIIKIVLYFFTHSVGRRTDNAAALALASDHRNDFFSAIGVAAGISLGRIGWVWADPAAGAIVALLVLKTGIDILREASSELMDTVPGEALDRQIRGIVRGVPGVVTVEDVGAHRFGPYFVVNVTIGIPGNLTVAEGDRIATEV